MNRNSSAISRLESTAETRHGTVAAVAERRHVYRVLTTDRRDFASLRVGPRLTRALDLLP